MYSKQSAVAFIGVRLPSAEVVYANNCHNGDDHQTLVDNFAFFADRRRKHPKTSTLTLFAERYGGSGILTHGGGARSALIGPWLAKGVGSTPLAGDNVPFWYGHGSLPLRDAMGEFIWSHILDYALPFGTAKHAAVIKTGRNSWIRSQTGAKIKHPGGILIREATLRLGSLERAPYYQPRNSSPSNNVATDWQRVATNLANLPDVFRHLFSLKNEENDIIILGGLREISLRIGQQSGAACSNQIYHGALASSNMALDCKWLDLGSVSVLDNFYLKPCFSPDIFNEYTKPLSSLPDIIYYIFKYTNFLDGYYQPEIMSELQSICINSFNSSLALGLLSRTGIPQKLVAAKISSEPVVSLAKALKDYAINCSRCAPSQHHDARYLFRSLGLSATDPCHRDNNSSLQLSFDRVVSHLTAESSLIGIPPQAIRSIISLNSVLRNLRYGWFTRSSMDDELTRISADEKNTFDLSEKFFDVLNRCSSASKMAFSRTCVSEYLRIDDYNRSLVFPSACLQFISDRANNNYPPTLNQLLDLFTNQPGQSMLVEP